MPFLLSLRLHGLCSVNVTITLADLECVEEHR